MTRNDVLEMMKEIKIWYPRFEFPLEKVKAWHEKLIYFDKKDIDHSLDIYIRNDERGMAPTIAQLLKSGRVSSEGISIDYETRKNLRLRKTDEDTYIDQEGRLWGIKND